jgi:hypothetical protein
MNVVHKETPQSIEVEILDPSGAEDIHECTFTARVPNEAGDVFTVTKTGPNTADLQTTGVQGDQWLDVTIDGGTPYSEIISVDNRAVSSITLKFA